jgi:hypothetical protein
MPRDGLLADNAKAVEWDRKKLVIVCYLPVTPTEGP